MESKNEKMKQRAEEISAGEQRIEFEKAASLRDEMASLKEKYFMG